MQFFNFQDTFTSIKSRLQEIEWKQHYVNASIVAANWAVVPFNRFLKHLLEVQGIDPNTVPGAKQREQFQQAVNEAFDIRHANSYDSDFDFSWAKKQFNQTPHIQDLMTREDRQRYRDHLPLERVENTSGVPLAIDRSPIDELAELLDVYPVNQIAPEPVEQEREKERKETPEDAAFTLEGTIDAPSIKNALSKLVAIAKQLENNDPELGLEETIKLMNRTQQLRDIKKDLIDIKKTTKEYLDKPSKRPSNPKIRRTKTGNVKAVKIPKSGFSRHEPKKGHR